MPILYTETHTNKKTSSPQQHRPRTNPPASVAHHPAAIIQHAQAAPESLSAADVLQLQRTIGNRAVVQLMYGIGRISSSPAQRWELEEEEELLQGKFTTECLQCQAPEEEELLQGKSEATQRQGPEEEEEEEEEELMQGKFVSGLTGTLQAKEEAPSNRTGMPDHLKSGLENISGMDLSGVRVHYNSPNPKQLNALAYTQGQEIHVGPGQEKHLLHEGWHAVQQMQGRVKPTMQLKDGVPVNDDEGLEREADVMGAKALANAAQPQGAPEEQELLQGKFAAVQRTGQEQGVLQTKKSASSVLALQRAYGNRAVQRLVASPAGHSPASIPVTLQSAPVLQRELDEFSHGGEASETDTDRCKAFAQKVSNLVDQAYTELITGKIEAWEGAKIATFLNMLQTNNPFAIPHAGNAIEERVYALMNANEMGESWTAQFTEGMGGVSFPDIVINLTKDKEGLVDITSDRGHILGKAGGWTTSKRYVYVAEAWFPSVTAKHIPNIKLAIEKGGITVDKAKELKAAADAERQRKLEERQAQVAEAREQYNQYESLAEFVREVFDGDRRATIKWLRDNGLGTSKGVPRRKGRRKSSDETKKRRAISARKMKARTPSGTTSNRYAPY